MAVRILTGDCRDVLRTLPAESVNCCVTSPPYFGLRSYGMGADAGEIGLELDWGAYVSSLVETFREARRVLREDATIWLNLGDSYCGSWGARGRGPGTKAPRPDLEAKHGTDAVTRVQPGYKPKDLMGLPWRIAFALQADGWWLRSAIVWHKPNPMPESVTDRPTSSYEMVFLLAKAERYYYDAEAISEPAERGSAGSSYHQGATGTRQQGSASKLPRQEDGTRNARNVWTIATQPFADAHFATMAPDLAERCIKAGCPAGGTVLDPFGGAGTTGLVADRLQRNAVLIELNPEYAAMARRRIQGEAGMFASVEMEAAE